MNVVERIQWSDVHWHEWTASAADRYMWREVTWCDVMWWFIYTSNTSWWHLTVCWLHLTTGFRSVIPKGRHSESRHSWSLRGIVLDIATTRRLTITLTLTISLTISCHCWKWLKMTDHRNSSPSEWRADTDRWRLLHCWVTVVHWQSVMSISTKSVPWTRVRVRVSRTHCM